MLTITPQAADAIRGVLASNDAPDGSVCRINTEPAGGNLVLSIVASARADDEIVEGEGVEVCVESDVAETLNDKVLDAMVIEGQVNFTISDQGEAPPAEHGPNGLPDPDREGPTPGSQ